MYKVELTGKGMTVAAEASARKLRSGLRIPSPVEDLSVSPAASETVTLADDLLQLLSGEHEMSFESEGQDVGAIAWEVHRHVDYPLAVVEEVFDGFVARGLLGAAPIPMSKIAAWLCEVNLTEHPRRLEILRALLDGPMEAGHLQEALGGIHVMSLRHHLVPLVVTEFVQAHHVGKRVHYTVERPMLGVYQRRMQRLFADMDAMWPVKTCQS